MSVGAQAMQDESVVAYDGAENEYFMSQGEYLTYQGTFSRHCVTEVVGDHAEQYVYVGCGFEDVITVRVDPVVECVVGSDVGLMLAQNSLHLFDEGESRL